MNAKLVVLAVCTLLGACAVEQGDDVGDGEAAQTKIKGVTKADREGYIAKAQVWSEASGEKDLLAGPPGEGSFQAVGGQIPSIKCTFVEPKRQHELGGKSPKFQCND